MREREREERGERREKRLEKKLREKKRHWWNKKLIFIFNLMLQ